MPAARMAGVALITALAAVDSTRAAVASTVVAAEDSTVAEVVDTTANKL